MQKKDFVIRFAGEGGQGLVTSADALARAATSAGYYTQTFSTFPSQIMGAMGGLILSGVMERHPQLRFAFLEANCSWLSWFLYRIDDQQQKYTDSPLILKPSEYFYRQCMISMEADEHLALPWVNATNGKFTVISTDYPHPDSAFPDSMNEFFDLDIKADVRRKILWDNCIRLYGIKD